VYVGIENGDAMTAIDTLQNKSSPRSDRPGRSGGHVPNAVPDGPGTENLIPLEWPAA